jgi:Xaa-Pro aminopeptidase
LTGEEISIHGLGLHPLEPPCFDKGNRKGDMLIQEGMYLSINVNIPDFPKYMVVGGNIGENVLVTAKGIENLTKGIPKQIR